MTSIKVSKNNSIVKGTINLAASKSESNRSLIINALCKGDSQLSNLANARDTQTMQRLLASNEEVLDVLDAGTTMRFLTAYTAVKGRPTIMTGSERMQQRPIGILVDALRSIGAVITYEKNEGYPPTKIHRFDAANENNHIVIRGDVSSQYISALLMVAPTLPNGLILELTGKVGSKPYIQMTLNLMKHFGVSADWNDNMISVPHQEYEAKDYTIEGDWSAASYWYSLVALADEAEVELIGLRKDSNQGDSVLAELMTNLGVHTEFKDNSIVLTKSGQLNDLEWDFTHCPDIAQTISVICAAKGVSANMTGLESLRIKETDRIAAIQNELAKFGTAVDVIGDEVIRIQKPSFDIGSAVEVATYEDHRMAMSFAPLGLLGPVVIEERDVVNKSYPDYWRDLEAVGFTLSNN